MSKYTEKIYDFIDKRLTEVESEEFIINLNYDKDLKEDYMMIQELNAHMKAKLMISSINSKTDLDEIENEARDDVGDFILTGKNDKIVLNYLSKAYPENDVSIKNKILKAESDVELEKIEELTGNLVVEYIQEDKKEDDFLKIFRKTPKVLNKGENEISIQKPKHLFNINGTSGRRKLLYLASSVAAIFIFILLLNNIFNNTPVNEKIFADYHKEPLKLNGTQMRGANTDINILFEEASELYKQNKFEEAFLGFQSVINVDHTFVQALFYSGLAQFENENYEESTQIFHKVISHFHEYNIESKWFLSLAYIKTNQTEKAIPYLKDISAQKSLYQLDAVEILKLISE